MLFGGCSWLVESRGLANRPAVMNDMPRIRAGRPFKAVDGIDNALGGRGTRRSGLGTTGRGTVFPHPAEQAPLDPPPAPGKASTAGKGRERITPGGEGKSRDAAFAVLSPPSVALSASDRV